MFYNLWAKFRIRERWRQEDGWDFWLVQVAAGEYSSALNLYSYYTNFISLFLKHTDFECGVGFSLQSIKFRYDSSIMTLLCTNNCIKLRTSTQDLYVQTIWISSAQDEVNQNEFGILRRHLGVQNAEKECMMISESFAYDVIYLQSIQHECERM